MDLYVYSQRTQQILACSLLESLVTSALSIKYYIIRTGTSGTKRKLWPSSQSTACLALSGVVLVFLETESVARSVLLIEKWLPWCRPEGYVKVKSHLSFYFSKIHFLNNNLKRNLENKMLTVNKQHFYIFQMNM